MLQIKNIRKEYNTGGLVQKALDGVSLSLRDSEFVAVLGPSGSGKTTLLNIIGGLDRYDSGDLLINGVSTEKYNDRDWDAYRNHIIGFVFQNYNLIPHQSILSNVELALTISGLSVQERRERARQALEEVGLGDQLHKKPGQMSGGQMQRVAIARALVNNPDILLADEPTGALDSETGIQVMELLSEVAKDRLVVMVTHNPELADTYATRIVQLHDGRITADTNPYDPEAEQPLAADAVSQKKPKRTSMSLLTALSLSMNNLWSKKTRTFLTAVAGSIGIIGIALILSVSNGANNYVKDIEAETMSEYPIQIYKTSLNISAMFSSAGGGDSSGEEEEEEDLVYVDQVLGDFLLTMDSNDLTSLKEYLDSGDSGIEEYASAVEYIYSVTPQIYRLNEDGTVHQVNPDQSFDALGGITSLSSSNSLVSSFFSSDVFFQMPENTELYEDQYDVKAGRWPENYNECVLVLSSDGTINDWLIYAMGLRDQDEFDMIMQQFLREEEMDVPEGIDPYSYEEVLGITFKVVNSTDYYVYDSEYDTWVDKSGSDAYMEELVAGGEDLTIVGIVQPAEDASGAALSAGINYPSSLITHIAEQAAESEIVQQQMANPDINVFTNEEFAEDDSGIDSLTDLLQIDEDALADAFDFDTSAFEDAMTDAVDADELAELFGDLDLSGMTLDLSDLDLNEILQSIDIEISQDAVEALLNELLDGYTAYAKKHPEADYTALGDDFASYLQTGEAQELLSGYMLQIIEENGGIAVSTESTTQLLKDLLSGYLDYASEQGLTDWSDPDALMDDYLETDAAQALLSAWFADIAEQLGDIEISEETRQEIASSMWSGYQAYASKNGLFDPSQLGAYIASYLQTKKAQKILENGIEDIIDTDSLQAQIYGAVMEQMTDAYGDSLTSAMEAQIGSVSEELMEEIAGGFSESMTEMIMESMGLGGGSLSDSLTLDEDSLLEAFGLTTDSEDLLDLLLSLDTSESASYDNNLEDLGYADFSDPNEVDIYPVDFDSKEEVEAILDDYNAQMEAAGQDDQVVTYIDSVGTMMSSVTEIINVISYVLIAFVAIALVVSSIMIGVITHISVLERRKEIGILRALGASKRNISQVFNAETFIIGLSAGLLGVIVTVILQIPINWLIHSFTGTTDINTSLPVVYALLLILLSVLLTLISGLLPARKAAKSDPVTALRSE